MSKDSDTSSKGNTAWRSLRFKQNKKQHRSRYYTIELKQKNSTQEQQKEIEVDEEQHYE